MRDEQSAFLAEVNFTRYRSQSEGFYESFFQRANHPARPLAFWIRYTLFSPKSQPRKAMGELWAIFFNGETNQHAAAKNAFPLNECAFSASEFHVQIGNAGLASHQLHGAVQGQEHRISWEISYSGNSHPLFLLPLRLYTTKFPAAKSLVGLPMARYDGKMSVNGESIDINNWVGSQNHNWGTRHTDRYAWGQVAGFDSHPDSFLEVATASLRMGPFRTPPVTPIVLRHKGKEFAHNGLLQAIRAYGAFDYFTWSFRSDTPQANIEGTISAPANAFVGLKYSNPPGGAKQCLNTKIASCVVGFRDKTAGTTETLQTRSRAAFEILTDDRNHGIPISA